MSYRVAPYWWPFIGAASPLLAPLMLKKYRLYKENLERTEYLNSQRIDATETLALPEVAHLDITVLVEEKTADGFIGDAAVSYYLKTDLGSLLFDVGFGPERPALSHNAGKLGITMEDADALAISHLHPDHMGGMRASRLKKVILPEELLSKERKPCYLPDTAAADDFRAEVVTSPMLLAGGVFSTGPLARSLFFFGLTEEQALVVNIKGKGLVVVTGCGHPKIEVIMKMVRKMSDEPVYAICGGLHFPVTEGRGNKFGLQFQRFVGTGLPPWQALSDSDLTRTISSMNAEKPVKVVLSGHDSCDDSISRFENELTAETRVFKAGETVRF